MTQTPFSTLEKVAEHLREVLEKKAQKKPGKSPFALVYAFNGTGKTRLSNAYRDLGREFDEAGNATRRDTLYFNAYTEDLFTWDNDLVGEKRRVLRFNEESRFFDGLHQLEMNVKIGKLLERYADFNFDIDYDEWEVVFFRERESNGDPIPIKISRGEENIFIWCFFLSILQLALDGDPAYAWVEHVFIDDPISSLDEHNAIVVGNHLVQLYQEAKRPIRTVVSTHHALFFNVLHYELKNHVGGPLQYVLKRDRKTDGFILKEQRGDTPQFYHVAALAELWALAEDGDVSTYHFNVLRSVLEKTAFFHGYGHFSRCIKLNPDDTEGALHQRFVDLLSHGKYSMYEPIEMGDDTKDQFRAILRGFVERHPFNPDLFTNQQEESNAE